MGDHLVVYVDRLAKPDEAGSVEEAKPNEKRSELLGPSSCADVSEKEEGEEMDEDAPLIGIAECRICQEEESVKNLENPCACSGSLKYAHRKCVQHWCNEKGDTTCEICHQPYQSGYTAPPRAQPEDSVIDIGGGWQISGMPLDMHDHRFLALAEAERQILEAEYDDYNAVNASGAAFFRSAALILMALLLLRHAMSVTDGDGGEEEDPSAIFSLFLLRMVGFLLPCYIMVWAISILQQRRQREEAAALAATQFAVVVQSAQRNGMQFTIASATPAMPVAQEPL